MSNGDKKIAIFTKTFLSPSMTFIYRQIENMGGEWDAFVITNSHINQHLFPFKAVYEIKPSAIERVIKKISHQIGVSVLASYTSSEMQITEVIKAERPSVIHAHFGPSAIDILPIARKLSIPMITTFHGIDASAMLTSRSYVRQLQDLFSYSKIITVSKIMAERLIDYGAPSGQVECIYIGVPLDTFKFLNRRAIRDKYQNDERITFLQVSNFVEKKGHAFTLKAFAAFREKHTNSKLLLAGAGPLLRDIRDLAVKLNCTDSVVFLGHKSQDDVAELMAQADCFLHHSVTASNGDQEGIPTVIMEAMATGLPVISTYHSGIPELIDNGVNGYLVGERDVDEYIEVMGKITEDDGSLGILARETVEREFDMDKLLNRVIRIYERQHCATTEGDRSV